MKRAQSSTEQVLFPSCHKSILWGDGISVRGNSYISFRLKIWQIAIMPREAQHDKQHVKKNFCCGMTNYSVFASFFMLLVLYKITQSINQQLTSLHKAAWRRRTRSTEKMPSRKVKMEERRKHHHFLSLRHSSSPKIGTPSPAPVSIASLIHPSFWNKQISGLQGFDGPNRIPETS